jgi:plasmid stabilization system protein ParE
MRAGPVPERPNSDLRELLELSYRIIYRPQAEVVTVLAVIHGRRASIGPVE